MDGEERVMGRDLRERVQSLKGRYGWEEERKKERVLWKGL